MQLLKRFLFENKGIAPIVFKNASWLIFAEGVSRLFVFAAFLLAARTLGPSGFGEFTFALAFVSLFLMFGEGGISMALTKEFSQRSMQREEFSSLISLRALMSIVLFLPILGFSFLVTQHMVIRYAIWILAWYVVAESFSETFFAMFRAHQKMKYEAIVRIVRMILAFGLMWWVLFTMPSVLYLSIGYSSAYLAGLAICFVLCHLFIQRLGFQWNFFIWKRFFKMSWPFALIALSTSFYAFSDSVMMGFWGQITQTGWYNGAYKIVSTLLFPALLLSLGFYPALSVHIQTSKEQFQRLWRTHFELMLMGSIPMVVGGVILAPKLIDLLYGASYQPSVLAFQILIGMAGLLMLFLPFKYLLIVCNQERKLFILTLAGAIINIVLNVIFIPRFSLYGAAATTLVSYLFLVCAAWIFSFRYTPIFLDRMRILKIVVASFVSSAILYFFLSESLNLRLPVIVVGLAGFLLYLTVFAFGYRLFIKERHMAI
ncbi:MAG: flippase [Candidatus Wildermuthbacteria bacterium]|nr:flippase [Candidatus Wildermuthbacteria bacterium]